MFRVVATASAETAGSSTCPSTSSFPRAEMNSVPFHFSPKIARPLLAPPRAQQRSVPTALVTSFVPRRPLVFSMFSQVSHAPRRLVPISPESTVFLKRFFPRHAPLDSEPRNPTPQLAKFDRPAAAKPRD